MALKPWREIAVPHEDVLRGTFQQAEFAADISKVHQGIATPEYQDAELFFQRTFITEGMRLLLDSVVKRIAGKGGDPVVQLQTAFGGGKTHTLLSVYHLAKGEKPSSKLQGISKILDDAGIAELPKAKIAVLDGVELLDLASKPRSYGKVKVKTAWGELAWQLGGEDAFAKIKEADADGTAPGKSVLAEILTKAAPCIVLMDELVRYVSQFEEGKALSGGTYDTQLSFIQSLTEAIKGVPNAILLASLPYSDREAGSQQGVKALRALEHYFGRVQALWKPVATEEAFEIVRRRLFTNVSDKLAAEDVCFVALVADISLTPQRARATMVAGLVVSGCVYAASWLGLLAPQADALSLGAGLAASMGVAVGFGLVAGHQRADVTKSCR